MNSLAGARIADFRLIEDYQTGTGRTLREALPILSSAGLTTVWLQPHVNVSARLATVGRHGGTLRLAIEGATPYPRREAFIFQPWMLGPRGKRTLLGVYDLIPLRLGRTKAAFFDSALKRAARDRGVHFVTLHESTRDRLAERYGIAEGRVSVARPGVSPGFAASPSSSDGGYVLCVGRNSAHKGINVLLQAWRKASNPSLVVVLPPGDAASRAATAMKREGVRVVAGLSDIELVQLYQRARMVVVPSLEEGFGLPLYEACLTGKAVVASDLDVFRDLPFAGVTYLPAGDIDAWADALQPASGRHLPAVTVVGALPTWDGWREGIRQALAAALHC